MDDPEEHGLPLLVAGGESAELLGLGEQPLDLVALLVPYWVERLRLDPVLPARDVREHVAVDACLSLLALAVKPFVSDQFVDHRDPVQRGLQQRFEPRCLTGLPRLDIDGHDRILINGRDNHLGRAPAPAAAKGFLTRAAGRPNFFFLREAPAAC